MDKAFVNKNSLNNDGWNKCGIVQNQNALVFSNVFYLFQCIKKTRKITFNRILSSWF